MNRPPVARAVVVFLHGAGNAGVAAWPEQAAATDPGWRFLERAPAGDDAGRDADRIVALLREAGGGHVVAHSYGGNAAVLAAHRAPDLVRTLALFEPACLDLARGKATVENHVLAMSPVFAVADDTSVSAAEFSRRFASAMGTEPPDLPADTLEEQVARLRALSPPWHTGVDPARGLPGPTLVVTGGWSPMYEEIAASLVQLGAQHRQLPGHRHRPQDASAATGLLRSFWIETHRAAPADSLGE